MLYLNRAINDAMSFPDVREKMTQAGLEVVQQPPAFFGDVLRQDYERYGKLAKDIGFKPQEPRGRASRRSARAPASLCLGVAARTRAE
jgi:hypothetical protein